jgi:hypothetical protein
VIPIAGSFWIWLAAVFVLASPAVWAAVDVALSPNKRRAMPGGSARLYRAELAKGLLVFAPSFGRVIVAGVAFFLLRKSNLDSDWGGVAATVFSLVIVFWGAPALASSIQRAPSIQRLLDDLKRIAPPQTGVPNPTVFKG